MQGECEGDEFCVMKRKGIDVEYALNKKTHHEKVNEKTEQLNNE